MQTGYSITSINYDRTEDGFDYVVSSSEPDNLAAIIKNSFLVAPLIPIKVINEVAEESSDE